MNRRILRNTHFKKPYTSKNQNHFSYFKPINKVASPYPKPNLTKQEKQESRGANKLPLLASISYELQMK